MEPGWGGHPLVSVRPRASHRGCGAVRGFSRPAGGGALPCPGKWSPAPSSLTCHLPGLIPGFAASARCTPLTSPSARWGGGEQGPLTALPVRLQGECFTCLILSQSGGWESEVRCRPWSGLARGQSPLRLPTASLSSVSPVLIRTPVLLTQGRPTPVRPHPNLITSAKTSYAHKDTSRLQWT